MKIYPIQRIAGNSAPILKWNDLGRMKGGLQMGQSACKIRLCLPKEKMAWKMLQNRPFLAF